MKVLKKTALAVVVVLMIVSSSLSVLAAVQGSQENPLVTLSYLKDVFTQSILKETDKKLEESKAGYEKKLDDKISALGREIQGGGGSGAGFTVVDLSAGQTLKPEVGCEIMLRAGTAQCVSQESPGLIDTTSGTVLEGGSALVKNHLYMTTVEGRSIKVNNGTVKLLVRGGYST